jgi:hypothetical protein
MTAQRCRGTACLQPSQATVRGGGDPGSQMPGGNAGQWSDTDTATQYMPTAQHPLGWIVVRLGYDDRKGRGRVGGYSDMQGPRVWTR